MKTHNIEQGSPEWFDLRIGKITGSSSARCVKSNWLEYADQLAAERLTGTNDDDNTFESFDMIRGKELEPLARQKYEQLFGIELFVPGFIQPDDMDYFGMSPDGIYKDMTGAIEIKSPRAKKHIQYIRHNKVPTEHMAQIIAAFICCESLKFVDFVSFCPDLDTFSLWVKRLRREDATEQIEEYRAAIIKTNIKAAELIRIIETGIGF